MSLLKAYLLSTKFFVYLCTSYSADGKISNISLDYTPSPSSMSPNNTCVSLRASKAMQPVLSETFCMIYYVMRLGKNYVAPVIRKNILRIFCSSLCSIYKGLSTLKDRNLIYRIMLSYTSVIRQR